ncbi:Acetyltransferase (fragment) [Hyella patelloides LEGE 07179]|uniref:Acetyltransferase n=1 Tax=Hyella patelloides LEGE 07179 TaxID=945734 RepID=A0A563W281_9CYAN
MDVVSFISLLGNEVGAIFVHLQHHKKGFGSGLINKAKKLRNQIYVEVFAANAIACRFYEKYGFEPIEEKVYEQTGFAIIRLQLPAKQSFSERSSQ